MKKNWNDPAWKFDLEDKYQWYLLHKRWRGKELAKAYDSDDFKGFTDMITKEKETYIYIHNKLTGDKKMEFKCDYLDRLEFIKSIQIHTKFINYLDSYILELEAYQKGKKELPKTKNKPGRPKAIEKPTHEYLLVDDENRMLFLEKLKESFKKSKPKEFAYLLISLDELKLLNTEYKITVFNSFKKYFGQKNGTYTNFNNHYKLRNDANLIKTTKDKIGTIKHKNVIL